MSLEQITTVVENFVNNPRNELLVIKGDWGVGKSYFWKKLVTKLRANRVFDREYYSGVSVFGLNSLDELKTAIAVNRIEMRAPEKVDSVNTNLAKLLKHVEKIPAVEKYVGSSIGTLLQATIRDTLICIDDVERKGTKLAIKDILGLCSLLKEERNCKLVIILNEAGLDSSSSKEFKVHGEKIIDRQVEFSMSAEESFNCVFSPREEKYELTRNCVFTLNVPNLRILQRIGAAIEDITPVLAGSEKQSVNSIIRSLILYMWSYYGEGNGAPRLNLILNYSRVNAWMKREKNIEESEEEKEWSRLSAAYDYWHTDEIDHCLVKYVQTGYLNRVEFDPLLEKLNQRQKVQAQDTSYRKAWESYGNSFDDEEEKFVSSILYAFRANIKVLPPRDLDGLVETLRYLGRDEEADDLIADYFAERSSPEDVKSFAAIRHSAFWDEIKDEGIVQRLRNMIANAQQDTRSLAEVVEPICLEKGWNPEDIPRMDSFSANDYYNFFKTYKGEQLYWCVRKCVDIGSNTGRNGMYKSIGRKTKEALLRIARETKLNRLRVSRLYKIDLPDAGD
jgi:hypothetical protein